MTDGVTRRDFLNGAALLIGAAVAPWPAFAQSANYPPGLTGLRGSHEGAYEAAHRVALEGQAIDIESLPVSEEIDMAIVGAGIAGLSAAYFARQRFGPRHRILVLDNHEDFGGHATRNEFTLDGRTLLCYGGSESLQSPSAYFSRGVKRLLGELGVEPQAFHRYFHRNLYPSLGLSRGVFFDRETFGADVLAPGDPLRMVSDDIPAGAHNAVSPADFVAKFPMSAEARAQLQALFEEARDPLAKLDDARLAAYLKSTSYPKFLAMHWNIGAEAMKFFRQRSSDFFGFAIDYLSTAEALAAGFPGRGAQAKSGDKKTAAAAAEPYIFHFPDGNASIARLLVHALIPEIADIPRARGSTRAMREVVSARFDYSRLDQPGAVTRIRLESTVVAMRNRGRGVDLVYARKGELYRVRAKRAVYCGWSMMLPHICKDVPEGQREAFASNVKSPIVYARALIRNWTSFVKLGVHDVYAPSAFFSRVKLDFPVSMGSYQFPRGPDEPMVLHMVHVPEPEGPFDNARERARAARGLLLGRSFAEFETAMREQLQRMLGAGGFDQARDIAAITVNRWSHGYSYMDNSLFDAPGATAKLATRARGRIGRIAIANSDTGFDAYLHTAIDEAERAVRELAMG